MLDPYRARTMVNKFHSFFPIKWLNSLFSIINFLNER